MNFSNSNSNTAEFHKTKNVRIVAHTDFLSTFLIFLAAGGGETHAEKSSNIQSRT